MDLFYELKDLAQEHLIKNTGDGMRRTLGRSGFPKVRI